MNLSAPFIKRPIMTTLVMAAIFLFGIFAYNQLPISDLPNIDYPTITVSAAQPGGTPDYMANLIATPLERNFSTISGLTTMTSANTFGSTQIILNFDLDVDLNSKEVEVAQAITATLPVLPPMPTNPTYEKFNPSDTPILFLVMTSDSQTMAELYRVGYNLLAQPISMIRGISKVQIYGFAYAARIQADPMKLMTHQIDLNTLASALINSNPNLPAGQIQGRYENIIINSLGMITSGEAYNGVMIQESGGSPLFVGDVADGISALEQRDPYFRYLTADQDQYMIVLAVSRLADSNTLAISKAVSEKIAILKKGIPGSMNLEVFYDKAGPILDSVNDVEMTLVVAFLLVVVVIFLYLGKLFETLIPSLVLPMTILFTFIVIKLIGFNLDILSLLALTLSIGFIIDDSIVVLENIVRHVEKGEAPYDAAMEGSRQISTTVFTMTIALSAVFIPFIWMPGILGRIFHEFALTIVVAILCSGFISLSLNPMLCSRFLKKRSTGQEKSNFSQKLNAALLTRYLWLLDHSIRFRKTTVAVGIACILFSIAMLYVLKTDFLPAGNLDLIEGLHVLQEGSSKVNTNLHVAQANTILQQYPHQKGIISIGSYPTDDKGAFYMRLKESGSRPNARTVAQEINTQLSEIVGVDTYVKPVPLINLQIGTTSSLGDYQYTLTSTDPQILYPAAKEFTKLMQALPEIIGVNNDLQVNTPQITLTIDRERAGVFGITAQEIESTLQYAYSGGRISTFNRDLNLYNLILEVAPGFDLIEKDLDLLYIKAPSTGALVPLTSVASWTIAPAAASINHIDTFPAVTISFNLAKGAALGTVLKKLDRLAAEKLPDKVIGKIQGSGEVFLQTFQYLRYLIVIAILVIYLLLGILYESFIHPITVLSALPVAVFGGLATLWLFNEPLSLYGVVGLIVLIGLVQKNGIIMIDFALEYLQQPQETPLQAILEACRARFRPIIMTTLAALMGALPIAIGFGVNGETNRPLGLAVVGGLIFSQLITLFVTPVVFLYMQDFHTWYTRKKAQV